MRFTLLPAALLAASPALAAVEGYPFWSLYNTDVVVALGFLVFVGILVYFRVPQLLAGLLDKRAAGIRAELDEARRLREEALELRASFERKRGEVAEQAERIVAKARTDAAQAAEQAKLDLEATITRRLKAAEEQIAAAETAALRQVRNSAVSVAVAAASEVLSRELTVAQTTTLVDDSIATVAAKLH